MLDLHLPLSNESVLAPATSSVPLATTELRIGRRAEILFSCWQLVFDAPVAKFYTLLLSFSFLITTLHIITLLLILSLVYFSQGAASDGYAGENSGNVVGGHIFKSVRRPVEVTVGWQIREVEWQKIEVDFLEFWKHFRDFNFGRMITL